METLKAIAIAAVLGLVFMAAPAWAAEETVKLCTVNCDAGPHLTDASGIALYWFTKDTPGTSACVGGCVDRWPIFHKDAVTPGPGLKAEDFGAITRTDGKPQTTYKGYPLYYFFKDKTAGTATGQGMGDVWYVIDPANFPLK